MHSHAYFLTVRSTLPALECSLSHCSGRKSDRRIGRGDLTSGGWQQGRAELLVLAGSVGAWGTPWRVIGAPTHPGERAWRDGVPAGCAAAGPRFYAVYVETLTFLFTDIEGSTALLGRLGDSGYARLLAGHHALVRSALAAHGGREMDTQGDAFFAVFSSPRGCVGAVLQMQRALQGHGWPGGEQVRVRMGIHCGEAAQTATGVVGLEVHRAARVAAVAYGGQVLVSEAAAVLVRDWLPPGAALADLGVHRLKDLGRPERIYQLDAAGLPAGFPPLRTLGHPALPNNLPVQLATFIGRDAELAEVRDLIASSRLVTLTGAGGTGKTRLVLQAAAELLDGTGDGVWLVELAAVSDSDAVPSAISAALGLTGPPGSGVRPAPAALTQLLEALAFQNVLIILDNCEHLIDACAKTADAILRGCRGCICWPPAVSRSASEARPSTGCRRCPFPDPMTPTRPGPATRSRCSSSGPKNRASTCSPMSKPARSWRRSAGGSTACRSPSSSPPPDYDQFL